MPADDRPTDDLLRRILAAALAEVGGARAERIVDEARAEAEEEVKSLVKSALKATLLRAAVEQLETAGPGSSADAVRPLPTAQGRPAGPELTHPRHEREPRSAVEGKVPAEPEAHPGAPACYVYAITPTAAQPWAADVAGVDPSQPLRLVRHEDVQAVVSRVSLDEFG